MRTIFLIIPAAIILASCGGGGHREKNLKKIDSLLTVVNYIKKTIAPYDNDTAKNRYASIKGDVEFYGSNLTTLPKEHNLSVTLSEYANFFKGYKRFFKTVKEIYTNSDISKKQLENLRKDIENRAIKGDEASLYIVEEEKVLTGIYEKTEEMVAKYNKLCSESEAIKPVVQQVIDSLKKQKKIQK